MWEKRFAMYAIPIYWFGVAYLFICSVMLINKIIQSQDLVKISENFIKNFLASISTVFLIFLVVTSSISFCENDNYFNCKPKYIHPNLPFQLIPLKLLIYYQKKGMILRL